MTGVDLQSQWLGFKKKKIENDYVAQLGLKLTIIESRLTPNPLF